MLKILIVDDEPKRFSFFNSVSVSLIDDPNDIHICSNQKEALSRLATNYYDVLIVDMAIPITAWSEDTQSDGGIELLQHIQEDDSLHRPAFIIGLTGSTDEDPEVAAFFSKCPWILMRIGASGIDWQSRVIEALTHAAAVKGREASITYDVDVCIITALMEPEYSAVIATNINWEADPAFLDSNTLVRRGSLITSSGTGLTVLIACSLRMGSVEAALLAAKLINGFRPRLLAMAGICAGVEGKVQYGDPILGTPVWDWTSSKWEIDSEGNDVVLPSPHYLESPREIVSRFQLLAQDQAFLDKVRLRWPASKSKSVLTAHFGPVASGPIVVADGKTLQQIKTEQNRQVLGLEMEAYGVFAAAFSAGFPRPLCFSIKSVCDFADPRKNDEMQKYAAYTSAALLHEFLYRFGKDLCSLVKD